MHEARKPVHSKLQPDQENGLEIAVQIPVCASFLSKSDVCMQGQFCSREGTFSIVWLMEIKADITSG